jgi:PAS domain S-box-containing protein
MVYSSGQSAFDAEAVVERAPLGLGVIGLDGRFSFVNPALLSVLGRPRREAVGAEAVSFLIEEEREPARANLAELFSGRRLESRTDRHYVRADGSVVLARLVTAAVTDPGGGVNGSWCCWRT